MIELPVSWTPWRPLQDSSAEKSFPATPGLYRVRRTGQVHLDYLGQTGRTLRKRLSELGGVYSAQIPFRDPHTAGPGLWALVHQGEPELEVSVTAITGDEPYRKAVEAAAIALHREQFGFSPTLNFGRMPLGYAMSSSQTRHQRGGLCTGEDTCHRPGTAPTGLLASWGTEAWCGHSWSPWQPLGSPLNAAPTGARGLYVIRAKTSHELLYIGQGVVRTRLAAHAKKASDHIQGQFFHHLEAEASWTICSTSFSNQLQELETDLIASAFLNTGAVPKAQFLGNRSPI